MVCLAERSQPACPQGADGEGGEAGAGDPRRDPEDPAGEAAVDLVEGGDPGDPEGDHGDAGQGGRGNKSLASLWGGMSALSVPGKAPWGQGEHVHAWVLVLPGSRQVGCSSALAPHPTPSILYFPIPSSLIPKLFNP